MYQQRKPALDARAKVLKAMAHPSRLFILEVLEAGERCVCDLTEMIGSDVSTVSKHLSVLKQAGIVADQKRGNQVFYQLRVPCILNFFGCVETVLQSQARDHAATLSLVGR
ncbi:MAG: transcriptional regulator [Desulfuromonas sp.]|nr:MAG: transcriptional regulator [Desulfuromonas sp.]